MRTIHRPDRGEEYDRLWKLRTVFDKLNEAYAKFYNPSEHLAVDEVIVKFKARVIFRQCIPKKKSFGIEIYKPCDESWYTYDMRVYLGRDSHFATDDMSATHTTVRHLTSRVEGSTKYLWTISFHPPDFLMIWTDIRFLRDNAAQKKRHAQLLWTKTTEIEKG